MFHQMAEHRKGFGREGHQLPATPQTHIAGVEAKRSEAKYLSCLHFSLKQF
jgi:hypothetical protein